MAEVHLKRRTGLKTSLTIGASNKVVVHAKLPVHFIEIPDFHFNLASPVVCLDDKEGLIHGLSHAFFYSKENPAEEMVIVGHADTSGEPAVNYPLSKARANAVKAILTGDEDAWQEVTAKAKLEDFQLTCKSLHKLYYWDCDPGAVDNADGPKTQRAIKGFQKEANGIFGLKLPVNGIVGPETWLGVFKVYRFLLSKGGVDADHPYKFANGGDGLYGCGESFPVKGKGNKNLVSRENRRVEIYFGPAGEIKPLDPPSSPSADLTAKECVLFDPKSCDVIPFGLKSSLSLRHATPEGDPIAGVTAKLQDASGNQVDVPKVTDADGFVFWFGLDEGDYEVVMSDAQGS